MTKATKNPTVGKPNTQKPAAKEKAASLPDLKSGEPIVLGYGRDVIVPVYGEYYAQGKKMTLAKQLYRSFGESVIQFSLTPPSPYQTERQWPEQPFLNVNVEGATETDRDNWLGYIHNFPPDEGETFSEAKKKRQAYIDKIIAIGRVVPVLISGKIIKEGSDYSVLLFASASSIDKLLPAVRELAAQQPKEKAATPQAAQKTEQPMSEAERKKLKRKRILQIILGVLGIIAGVAIIIGGIALVVTSWATIIAIVMMVVVFASLLGGGNKKKR